MNLLKNIFILFTTLILFVSSNGFFVEQYLCNACNEEHSEITFFEFGEYSHNHKYCTACDHSHSNCLCSHSDEGHLEHAKVSFYSFDKLFFEYELVKIPQIKFLDNFNLQVFPIDINKELFSFNSFVETLLKIPSLFTYQSVGQDVCTLISVFRL